MTILLDTSRTSCFVSPALCKHLNDSGLSDQVAYQWKIYRGIARLVTYVFDEDDYYKDGAFHQDFVNPPDHVLPAYSIKEVEKLLPSGYLLTFADNYEISLSMIYQCESVKADRMPDAYAMMLFECIRKKVVNLKKINQIIER